MGTHRGVQHPPNAQPQLGNVITVFAEFCLVVVAPKEEVMDGQEQQVIGIKRKMIMTKSMRLEGMVHGSHLVDQKKAVNHPHIWYLVCPNHRHFD